MSESFPWDGLWVLLRVVLVVTVLYALWLRGHGYHRDGERRWPR